MGLQEILSSIPKEKNDPPVLLPMGGPEYDFHDVDGLFFMLDRKLSGCMMFLWTKPMDASVRGSASVDGKMIGSCVLESMPLMGGMWVLGVPLRGHVREYGREYSLHIEGFRDSDGNEMTPFDMTVRGIDHVDPDPAFAEHERIALEAAREGIVLLKNERNTLPLKGSGTLNLLGRGVHEFRTGAVGAGKINPRYTVNFLEAVMASGNWQVNQELADFYACGEDRVPPEDMLERARNAEDTAILFLSRPAGENMDLSTAPGEYYLTADEEELIRTAAGYFSHTIAVLNVGYPIDVRWADTYGVDAVVYLGFAGMLAGPALLDMLTGAVSPSGKLPDTWAKDYFDIPSSRNFYNCVDKPRLNAECQEYVDTVYEEDLYVGYRYFDTFHVKPAYPFGYGLSYTTFIIEPTEPDFDGTAVTMQVFVKNMGRTAGKEVVQVYVGKPDTDLEKPEKELAFFHKTALLGPGEIEEIEVRIPAEHLCVYSERMAAYLVESGEYTIYAGNSSLAKSCGSIRIREPRIIKKVKNRMTPNRAFTRLSRRDPAGTFPQGRYSGVVDGKTTFLPYAKREIYPVAFNGKVHDKKITFDDVRRNLTLADDFTAQFSVEELARLCVCASAGWGMEGIGEAGSLYPVEGWDLPKFPVSDGNSGVNLNTKNIGMPSGVTMCASWNTGLCEEIGRVIGEEAKSLGAPMILAPALNIHRNPLNGRQPEYFSEDPYLAGVMAGFYDRGMENTGTASTMKHLMANNCESSRKRNQSIISERAIREIYFRTFQYAMEIHMPASVMTAYNAVNGVPTAADADLILGLLREENGFDGFVMTDWTTYDTVDCAAMVQAGNAWITPGSLDDTYTKQIIEGINNGTVETDRLRENVAGMLRIMAEFS